MKKKNDHFITSDIRLAAALSCIGFGVTVLVNNQKEAHPRLYLFHPRPDLKERVVSFYVGTLLIDPSKYCATLDELGNGGEYTYEVTILF